MRRRKRMQRRRKESKTEKEKWKLCSIYYLICDFAIFGFFKFNWRYISNMKNIKNHKLLLEAEQEFEVTRKRRKESLQQIDTLFRIDPTIQDEFTEEAPLPRLEKNLSSHTKTALWPTAVSCFGHFITVHVENIYAVARAIPFFVLYRGPGTGSVKKALSVSKNTNALKIVSLKK